MKAEPPEARRRLRAAGIVLACGLAVAAVAFAYGLSRGRRGRRIHAEQQLDMVTQKALEVRDLMAAAAPSEEPRTAPPLRLIGRDDNEVTPGPASTARRTETSAGDEISLRSQG